MKLTLALLSLVLAASSAFARPIDLGSPSSATPYDRYMGTVKNVLSQLDDEAPSMREVQQLVRKGRSFRYSYTTPYVAATPETTAATRAGDCKAKSLWLVNQLRDENVRYVIGKAKRGARLSHAWVMWEHEGQWWILDCTNLSRPVAADRVSRNEYIPYYSYDKTGAYRHAATQIGLAEVAQSRSPVASDRRR